jgi:UDP-N-acetylglucosamine:LPS N-acetylglucosamine transferase
MIVQKDLTPQRLAHEIEVLRARPERLRAMETAVRQFHHPRAAEALVHEFVERIEQDASR